MLSGSSKYLASLNVESVVLTAAATLMHVGVIRVHRIILLVVSALVMLLHDMLLLRWVIVIYMLLLLRVFAVDGVLAAVGSPHAPAGLAVNHTTVQLTLLGELWY